MSMQSHPIAARMPFIIITIFVAFSIIIARLAYIQVVQGDYFAWRSKKNFLRTHTIKPVRGTILDRNHNPLATNKPIMQLWWKPTGNRHLTQEQKLLLSQLQHITQTDFNQEIEHITFAERLHKSVLLINNLSGHTLGIIQEQYPAHPNLTITIDYERHYPYQHYGCHILGYLQGSHSELHEGKTGLEKMLEQVLKGSEGVAQKIVTSTGRRILDYAIHEPQAGETILSTLDMELQHICEQIFPLGALGTIIIMDPHQGDIYALLSRPSFNPTIFLHPLSSYEWHALQQDQPLLNRACCATYPPGSIFKLVSVSAALEQGIINQHDTIMCTGSSSLGNHTYWCHQRWGHGSMSICKAVAQSCNILFYELAKNPYLDIDTLAQYAHKFGLGHKTGISLPECTGLVPTRAWKHSVKHERWWPGETLAVAIGQSFLLVTPLQVARMIASIFTGFLVTPRILQTQEVHKELLDIKPETRAFLQKSMKSVVKKGTGKRMSTIKDIEIYAKTSTAQTSSYEKRNLGHEFREHGCMVLYFKYKNEQPLVAVFLIEHAGSSKLATDTARHFLIEYKKLIDKKNIKS